MSPVYLLAFLTGGTEVAADSNAFTSVSEGILHPTYAMARTALGMHVVRQLLTCSLMALGKERVVKPKYSRFQPER